MTSRISRTIGAATAACCLLASAAAQAQSRPDRPYRGLFGGGTGSSAEQSLSASAATGVTWSSNVLKATLEPDNPDRARVNGFADNTYEYLTASLSYGLRKRRVTLGAGLTTSGQYLPNASTRYIPSHQGSVGASLRVSRRAEISGGYTATLQPYNLLLLGPPTLEVGLGQVSLADPTFGVNRGNHLTQTTTTNFHRTVGRRGGLDMTYGYTRIGESRAGEGEMTSHSAGGRYSFGISRFLGAHAGYGYQEGHLGGDSPIVRGHNIDAGIDFNRAIGFPFSRRTRVSFSTGSSAVQQGKTTFFRLNGNAMLIREIGRTWSAIVAYDRGMTFIERFREPLLYDGLSATFGGLITRRLQFSSSAGAVTGRVGVGDNANPYRSYFGSVGLSTAITRFLAIGTNYTYYNYGFDQFQNLPIGLPRRTGRQAVGVYLSTWLPLIERGRSPDATR